MACVGRRPSPIVPAVVTVPIRPTASTVLCTLLGMKIRAVRTDEGPLLRALWLRALTDAPAALGSAPALAGAYPDAIWCARARPVANRISLIAEAERDDPATAAPGRWCGMVTGTRTETQADQPVVVALTALWVDPAQRGCGLGNRLVQAVVAWARGQGAAQVTLEVVERNAPAIALYLAAGFRGADAPAGDRAASGRRMLGMTLSLTHRGREPGGGG